MGGAFEVHLDNFTGPFDLLLSLITARRLDITEVALAAVTDEFVAYLRAGAPGEWDLSTASEFVLVAATLLDLKAARLLPSTEVDEEDLALLEARDLLFARLLQYRAFKQVAATVAAHLADQGRRYPRLVALEPHLAAVLPELVWRLGPGELAALAARALAPKPAPPTVPLAHLHAPAVSVAEQAAILAGRLQRERVATFRSLTADTDQTAVVVARFLALLELFRQGVVGFDQVTALGELSVHWSGDGQGPLADASEFDIDETEQERP